MSTNNELYTFSEYEDEGSMQISRDRLLEHCNSAFKLLGFELITVGTKHVVRKARTLEEEREDLCDFYDFEDDETDDYLSFDDYHMDDDQFVTNTKQTDAKKWIQAGEIIGHTVVISADARDVFGNKVTDLVAVRFADDEGDEPSDRRRRLFETYMNMGNRYPKNRT
jgi:hypothetical protein